MQLISQQKGFTLFEVLIYIALFSLIMGAALMGAYQIIESSAHTTGRLSANSEAHFISRKIDWALNGEVTDVGTIPNGLHVRKDGQNYNFVLSGDGIELNGDALTSSAVTVNDFDVIYNAGPPKEVSFTVTINGQQFASNVHYIR